MDETVIRVALSGAAGHMGRRVGTALAEMPEVDFSAGLVKTAQLSEQDIPAPLTGNLASAIANADVIIDFTARERSMELAAACAEAGRALLVGTTGLTDEDIGGLKEFAADCAIVYSPNLTRGAATLFGAAEQLARRLGPGYDAKLIGIHHNKKKETPSGTSAELARRIGAGRGDGEKPEIATVLAGGTYGIHEILFASANDEIRISHTVTRPEIDKGVLLAALDWLATERKGFAGIADII